MTGVQTCALPILPAEDRGAFVLYHSPNLPGVVNGNSRAGFDGMLERLRAEALGPKGSLKVALDDEAFDPAGYLSASARTIAMEPDGRFSLPGEFAEVLDVADGVMLVNPAKHAHVKKELGQAFVDWLISAEGQKTISDYKISGAPLFFPNAQ